MAHSWQITETFEQILLWRGLCWAFVHQIYICCLLLIAGLGNKISAFRAHMVRLGRSWWAPIDSGHFHENHPFEGGDSFFLFLQIKPDNLLTVFELEPEDVLALQREILGDVFIADFLLTHWNPTFISFFENFILERNKGLLGQYSELLPESVRDAWIVMVFRHVVVNNSKFWTHF